LPTSGQASAEIPGTAAEMDVVENAGPKDDVDAAGVTATDAESEEEGGGAGSDGDAAAAHVGGRRCAGALTTKGSSSFPSDVGVDAAI
jgi:hypothetical protein